MIDSGLYAIVLALKKPAKIKIGALGLLFFAGGTYIYIGSAKKNLHARIARHKRRSKPLRWHIDYLRPLCRFEGFVAYLGRHDECHLAANILKKLNESVPYKQFGTSDCRCSGHLLHTSFDSAIIFKKLAKNKV